jgi:hypothetical protein
VIDDEGRLSGVNVHSTFVSASVVKAMLLVAYLRRLDAEGQHDVDAASNGFLYPMINVSDNTAATKCWSIVGESGLEDLAGAAGMTDFSVYGFWANAQISAADQAWFFDDMDDLIPGEFVGYARGLPSGIAAYESWGVPPSPARAATQCSSREAGERPASANSCTRWRGSRAAATRSRSR